MKIAIVCGDVNDADYVYRIEKVCSDEAMNALINVGKALKEYNELNPNKHNWVCRNDRLGPKKRYKNILTENDLEIFRSEFEPNELYTGDYCHTIHEIKICDVTEVLFDIDEISK